MDTTKFMVDGTTPFSLASHSTKHEGTFESKKAGRAFLADNTVKLDELQARLAADGKAGILAIFQGMDASGKDGAIRAVFSGMNQYGVNVYSFKAPTSEELAHDYLWRIHRAAPQRGQIAVFNRSHYEDVLIVKVRKLYENLNTLDRAKGPDTIEERYRQIVEFEKYLWENAIIPVKFMLNISKDEQRKRFLSRIDDPAKNWKFEVSDIAERELWDEYQQAYEDAINATATKVAPWYVVPADNKWFTRAIVSQVVLETLENINPQYPEMDAEFLQKLAVCRTQLLAEQADDELAKDGKKE